MRTNWLSLKVFYVALDTIGCGKVKTVINGASVYIYDRERTVLSFFRYPTRLNKEETKRMIDAYIADDKKNVRNLALYARRFHLSAQAMSKVNSLLDILEKKH